MTNKKQFRLVHAQARNGAMECIKQAPYGWHVTVQEATRSLDQNAKMWPILQAFSEQMLWPVNGRMVKMTPDEWKDVLTAAFRRESARLAMGLDGGVVMLGSRTSKMGVREMSEFIEFLQATAADREVDLRYMGENDDV